MKRALVLAVVVCAIAVGARGQFVSSVRPAQSGAKGEAVQYLFPEQVTVAAGKATAVALHFRVAAGLHVNSHTPSDEFLIPTVFSIPDGAGVKLAEAKYPSGVDITLPADPKTKLNVYTGEFTIDTRLVAAAGNHLVQAKLRYQACDQTQCLPPKTITVPIDVIGR
jgi:hypothetical protein